MPRQLWPSLIERAYGNAMVDHLARARAVIRPLEQELPTLLADARASRGDRTDAGEGRRAQSLIDRARASMRDAVSGAEVESLARDFAQQTQTFQRKQLGKQVHAALGVDKPFRDRHLSDLVDHFVSENVALIRSVPDDVHDDLEGIVHRAISGGKLHAQLAGDIDHAFDVGESHARLIARDQIGKLYAQVNRSRIQELGVRRFIWRTVGDDRVRDEHEQFELESESEPYDYDDPPLNEDGEPVLPGDEVGCRCYDEPVFEDILSDEDAGDSDDEDAGDADDD